MSRTQLYRRCAIILLYLTGMSFLVFSTNQYINQKAFKNIFGFYLVDSFFSLRASLFDCFDCDAKYISFRASESVIKKIVTGHDCDFQRYDYKKHGDYLGSIEVGAPSFWKECINGKVCAYKDGGLWYNEDTHLLCYAHILL